MKYYHSYEFPNKYLVDNFVLNNILLKETNEVAKLESD